MITNHAKYANNYQILTEYLRNEANEVKTLDLLVSGAIPDDCNVLMITELKEDITEYERDLILNYINKGGNLLIMKEPNTTGVDFKNFQTVLDTYGVKISNGIVYEALILNYINKGGNLLIMKEPNTTGVDFKNFQTVLDTYGVKISNGIVYEANPSRTINGYANIMLPSINNVNDITKYIATDGAMALIDSGAIEYQDDEKLKTLGVTVQNLATASDTAFLRTDNTQTSVVKTEKDQDAAGKPLVASIDKKINDTQTSKLVIFASSTFASDLIINLNGNTQANRVVGIGLYNNKDIVINSISYLTERTDNITIRKDTGVVTYTATQAEHQVIIIIICALPILVIVTGIIIWQIRRRKK